jgi:leucyl aminopeptidase
VSSPTFPTIPPRIDFSVSAKTTTLDQAVTLLVLPVVDDDGQIRVEGGREIATETGINVERLLEQAAGGEPAHTGVITQLPVLDQPDGFPKLRSIMLLGVDEGTPEQIRRAAAVLARASRGHGDVVIRMPGSEDGQLSAVIEGMVLGSFELTVRQDRLPPVASRVWLVRPSVPALEAEVIPRAIAAAHAAWHARRLATMPSNIKSPEWLADEVVRLLEDTPVTVTRFDDEQLRADGFGGIVAVGQGSSTPPTLLKLEYQPKSSPKRLRGKHVVLVGKGITFDTGGLSIKPAESMSNMKRDMTGAAVVASVMSALGELECQVRVTALLPIAENAVSGSASRPGDVITHYGGRTTEITNTDAEGRLVLADALAYAVDQLKPSTVIDIATLTGGAKVALGTRIGALFSTSDELAVALDNAGQDAGEPLWRLPLSGEYRGKLHSSVADAVNSSGGPPAITAALFLKSFVGDTEWAHLDIASVGDAEEDRFEWTKGPTGFGVRTILRWLTQFSEPRPNSDQRSEK